MASARDSLPRDKIRPAIALLSVTTASGIGVGYPVSGAIAQHVSLHAAYWFGAVFVAIALLAVLAVVPHSSPDHHAKVDVAGTAILTAGLVALLLAIGEGETWGWTSAPILALIAAAVVILPFWCRHQLASDQPLVDLRLARHRQVMTANAAAFVLGIAMYMDLSDFTAFVQATARGRLRLRRERAHRRAVPRAAVHHELPVEQAAADVHPHPRPAQRAAVRLPARRRVERVLRRRALRPVGDVRDDGDSRSRPRLDLRGDPPA